MPWMFDVINSSNAHGWSPLHLAAAAPHADRAVKALLRAQAEVSITHPVSGMTPLMLSAEAGTVGGPCVVRG
eukprot:Skav201501  [mRNA]  locus=scaffold1154:183001:188261:+ [translate_table: standard]